MPKQKACFLSVLSQRARLGIILEYFMKWLKHLDGMAFNEAYFDCASFLKEVFGVHCAVL